MLNFPSNEVWFDQRNVKIKQIKVIRHIYIMPSSKSKGLNSTFDHFFNICCSRKFHLD